LNKSITIILYLLIVTIVTAHAQESYRTAEKVDSILKTYHDNGVFNGCALVMHEGKAIVNQAFGYASPEKTEVLTADHRFGIGSIYKEFPAVLIMQLQEKGFINLHDTIDKFIPNLPEWSKSITILNLLQYTSGLPMIQWNKYFSKGLAINEDRILSDLLDLEALEFKAGSDYIYTNNSPFLLIKIIEKVSGESFSELVQRKLFDPSGIKNSVFKSQYPYKDSELMAIPFNSEYEQDQYDIEYSSILLTTTTKDLYHWFENINTYKIINRESLIAIAKSADLELENMQAPLGNCHIKQDEIKEHIHHGSMGNYEALVSRDNKEGWTIVLLTNQKNQNLFEITDLIKNEIHLLK